MPLPLPAEGLAACGKRLALAGGGVRSQKSEQKRSRQNFAAVWRLSVKVAIAGGSSSATRPDCQIVFPFSPAPPAARMRDETGPYCCCHNAARRIAGSSRRNRESGVNRPAAAGLLGRTYPDPAVAAAPRQRRRAGRRRTPAAADRPAPGGRTSDRGPTATVHAATRAERPAESRRRFARPHAAFGKPLSGASAAAAGRPRPAGKHRRRIVSPPLQKNRPNATCGAAANHRSAEAPGSAGRTR